MYRLVLTLLLCPVPTLAGDSLIPLRVEMTPLNQAKVGGSVQYEITVESGIDPDLVHSTRIEYDIPERLRRAIPRDMDLPLRSGRGRTRFEIRIPDDRMYEVRARVVVELRNGRTIAQTAVRWINRNEDDHPAGMLRRIVDPDGTTTRVYQGVTTRK